MGRLTIQIERRKGVRKEKERERERHTQEEDPNKSMSCSTCGKNFKRLDTHLRTTLEN